MHLMQVKYWVFLLPVFLFTACNKDSIAPNVDSQSLSMAYRPTLSGFKGNESVKLNWGWFTYNVPTSPLRVDPEKFEVWMAEEDTSNFSKLSTLPKEITTFTPSGLKNGTAYFFQIIAITDGAQAALSNRIMIVPGKDSNITSLFPNDYQHRTWGSWIDLNTITYMMEPSSLVLPARLSRAIYQINLQTDAEIRLTNGAKPDPSPDGTQLVFETDLDNNIHDKSSKTFISLFNFSDNSTQTLFGGDDYNHEPNWSPDGKAILFISNLGGADNFNIYSIALDGSISAHAYQLTERFSSLDPLTTEEARSPRNFGWSADASKVIYNRFEMKGESFAQDIFEIEATGGSETAVITSEWNDSHPSYSHNGKYLAFISDRSGVAAIWVLLLESGKLLQLTGSSTTLISTTDSKLDWSPNDDQILFSSPVTDQINTLKTVDFP